MTSLVATTCYCDLAAADLPAYSNLSHFTHEPLCTSLLSISVCHESQVRLVQPTSPFLRLRTMSAMCISSQPSMTRTVTEVVTVLCKCCSVLPALVLMLFCITGQAPPSASAYLTLSAALPVLQSCALGLVQTLLWTGQGSLLLHYAPMARMMSNLLRKIAAAPDLDPAPAATLLRQQVGYLHSAWHSC